MKNLNQTVFLQGSALEDSPTSRVHKKQKNSNKISILFLFFVFGFSHLIPAQLQDSHFYKVDQGEVSSGFKLQGFWRPHVEGYFLSNREGRERLMKVKLYSKFDVLFNSYISGHFEPYLSIEEGEIQRRFARPESSLIQMNQGFFDFHYIEGLNLQLGAVNQSYFSAPLLVSDQAFLSALLKYAYIKQKYEWQVVVQQSMPSIVNSFRRNNEIAESPYFSSLFVYGEWLPSDHYSFKAHGTGFYFAPLPAFIAYQSRTYGNTVFGEKSSADFAYSYYGFNGDISAQIHVLPELYFSLGWNGLINLGAPFEKAYGERIYGVVDMDFLKWAKVYSRLEYFYNTADSAPSYFNSEIYGHNDRKGFLTELKAFFPNGNFEVGLRYVLSSAIQQEITSSSLGERQHSFMVFVSSRYLSM